MLVSSANTQGLLIPAAFLIKLLTFALVYMKLLKNH